jgi:hypothetical protein
MMLLTGLNNTIATVIQTALYQLTTHMIILFKHAQFDTNIISTDVTK